jgi:hypothetical protein
MRTLRLAWIGALIAAGALEGTARADSSADAEQLFQEGKALMAAKDYAAACPKFARSQHIDPATGTLLALALCHEAQGLTATAWTEFHQAIPLARKESRDDRVEVATTHIDRLQKRLSWLVVHVSAEANAIEGLRVTRDGELMAADDRDSAVPVDPGGHVVVATAPGHETWQGRIKADEEGKRYELTVPDLPAIAHGAPVAAPAAEPVQDDEKRTTPGLRWAAYGLLGVGAAAVVVGGVFGVRAISDSNQAKGMCAGTQCSDPRALSINDEARSSATVANVALAAGVVAVGAGAILWLLSPSTSDDGVHASAGANGALVSYSGRF